MPDYVCRDCGKEFCWPKYKPNHCCPECSFKHVVESVSQMRAKKGPYYEKWKESHDAMMAYMRRHKE